MIKVSIIIPYLRDNIIERCISSIKENAGIPEEEYEIVAEKDVDRIGCPKMVKRLVYKASANRVLFIGEDVVVKKDFLKEALLAMDNFSDGIGLVALNDGDAIEPTKNRNCKLASHWIADKGLLPLLDGEFFHTGYDHSYCDNELTERCYNLGKYFFAEKSIVAHVPVRDEFHRETRCRTSKLYDRALYEFRRENNWTTPLIWDGERCVPNCMHDHVKTYMEHNARYNYSLKYIRNKKVLDASCGSGYGVNMYYDLAKEVHGVDRNPAALSYAKQNYRGKFGYCDLNKDFPDEEYEVITSFETIEHLEDPTFFLNNVKKHSKEFMFSIPIEAHIANNHNEFHLHKYSYDSAKKLVADVFSGVRIRCWSQAGLNFYDKRDDTRFLIGYLRQ